jgi:hypothetical protein|tara:strand:+ start:165 stop:539 length:375 start_codon:yes stop_codon:yes gene_type:complete
MKIKITQLDKLFSEYIRRKSDGICSSCGKNRGWKNLQASHYLSRRKASVRFDEDNVAAQCFTCHMDFHGNPEAHRNWKIEQIGMGRYVLLLRRGEKLLVGKNKMTPVKKEALRRELKRKIADLV